MTDYTRGYSKGYARGLSGRWPEHRPPEPPNDLVRAVLVAAQGLRDAADGICATISEDDDFALELAPHIDLFDDAMIAIRAWLIKTGAATSGDDPLVSLPQPHAASQRRTGAY